MKRVLWTLAFLAAGLAIVGALAKGVPYLLYRTGLGTGYRVGWLRGGTAAFDRPFSLVPDELAERGRHVRRWRVGWALAREGEHLSVELAGSAERGRATLVVDEFLGGGVDPLWSHALEAGVGSDPVRATIPVPATGLYYIRFAHDDFVGEWRVAWRVGAAGDGAGGVAEQIPLPMVLPDLWARDDLPVVAVDGPTVVAFWTVPASDPVLEADTLLAMALDEQQVRWADTRGRLEEAGFVPVDRPGRRFLLDDGLGRRTFAAHPDSSHVGYLLVAPGREPRVLYRVRFPEDLVEEARRWFDGPGGGQP